MVCSCDLEQKKKKNQQFIAGKLQVKCFCCLLKLDSPVNFQGSSLCISIGEFRQLRQVLPLCFREWSFTMLHASALDELVWL